MAEPPSPPVGVRPRRFFLGMALALTLAAGWELTWRAKGFVPSVSNSNGLWSVWRAAASKDPRVVALVGSSRLQAAMDLDVLERHFPGRELIQLSVNSGHLLGMLRDFAEDPTFHGTLVVEVLPADLFTSDATATNMWVEKYHARAPLDGVETSVRTWFSSRLVSLLPELGMASIPHFALERHRAPPLPYYRMDARRQLRMNFALADLAETKRFFADALRNYGTVASDAEMAARLTQLQAWVAAITARGGHVIFFRMLATQAVLAVEEERFPDARYWALIQKTFPSLSFQDFPAMQAFACPDGTHIDGHDATPFTELFAQALSALKLLKN